MSVVLPELPRGDLVWTWQHDLLLLDRAVEIVSDRHLTGLRFKPVKARFATPGDLRVPRLREACPVGWGGMAPPESGVKLLETCAACGLLTYSAPVDARWLIDPSQWDGTDFFIVWPLPRFIFLSERAASVLKNVDRGGGRVWPLERLQLSGTLSPGRLSYWFPERQARRIGVPLGIY